MLRCLCVRVTSGYRMVCIIFSSPLRTIASKRAIGRPGTEAIKHINYRLNVAQDKTGCRWG